ncbi:meiotically up-regulated 65 protein [Drechmeria coniospora]|uniref:Meiotically up-regulated 65 protein n=1 Tax=Drechmeria coniospora TaxID=98403 RepID=A0A151GTT2_DRECN|nr:meiotically up-regulated 65 protein [Drechmeria coniospora]KYK60481.1 meiotically up-regulated 65 protein [Drechmeria coniospora]ODA80636.1 hypothetical protein RJ55_03595 [Drechmeria coniospora]
MVKVRSSRRVTGLRPSDYDHEIGLVNHDEPVSPTSPTAQSSSAGTQNTSPESQSALLVHDAGRERPTPRIQGDQPRPVSGGQHNRTGSPGRIDEEDREADSLSCGGAPHEAALPQPALRPSIEVQAPSAEHLRNPRVQVAGKKAEIKRETTVDILYENERGGFLCGIALFSSKALGGLDPPAWTNAYHKTSPTNIFTAQVPDPSWEWVWPEWRLYHQEGEDEGGWEYSFAFSRTFSWHRASWWNSFVRKRTWIRKRAKKKGADVSSEPQMLNANHPANHSPSDRSPRLNGSSAASSRAPSKPGMSKVSHSDIGEDRRDIESIEALMQTLRQARIDREKLEAVDNYLEHAMDLSALQDEMHEIMSFFVFQASRRQLLSHMMKKHDGTIQELEKMATEPSTKLLRRREALDAAIVHADEEVRRLAYWSDIKHMADSGEVGSSSGANQCWFDTDAYQGLDHNGPASPTGCTLPGKQPGPTPVILQ